MKELPIDRYLYYIKVGTTDADIANLVIDGLGTYTSAEPGCMDAQEHLQAIWKKYGKLPSLGAILSKINPLDTFEANTHAFLTKANAVQVGPYDKEILKTELRAYVRQQKWKQHYLYCLDNSKKDGFDYCEAFAAWVKEDAKWAEPRNLEVDNLFDQTQVIEAFKDRKVINSDLTQLDEIIGGWECGGLYTLLGPSNVGKTLFCVHLARSFALNGKNVLYLNYEGNIVEIKLRIQTSLVGVPVSSMKDNLKDYLVQLSTKPNGFGELRLQDVSADRTVHNIEQRIQEYKDKLGISFDVVIIDQLSKLQLKTEKKNDTLYTKFDEISMALKDLATKLNMVFITPIQANRAGYGQGELGMDNSADSISIVRNCDVMIGIGQNEDEKKARIVRVMAIKSRYKENGGRARLKVDYTLQRLADSTDDDLAAAADSLAKKPKVKRTDDDFGMKVRK